MRFHRSGEMGTVEDLGEWEQIRKIQAAVHAGMLRDLVVVHDNIRGGSRVILRWWDADDEWEAVETLEGEWGET